MAKQPARSVRIYLNEHPLAGYLNTHGIQVQQENPVVTTFVDDGPRVVPANYSHTWDFGGFGEYNDDLIDELVEAWQQDTGLYVTSCPLSTSGYPTENTVAMFAEVVLATRPQSFQAGQAAALSFQMAGNSELARGLVLRSASVTGVGNGTGRNMGATTAGQKFGVLFRVLSGTFTSLALKLQESSDDGGGDAYADISGLVSGTISAPGVVFVSTTSATEAWKRVAVSSFSGTDARILVVAGRMA